MKYKFQKGYTPWNKKIFVRPEGIPLDFKQCNKCRDWMSLDKFNKSIKNIDGYEYQCKKCRTERARACRKKWSPLQSLKQRFSVLRSKSKLSGRKSDFSFDEYCEIVKKECHYCDGIFGRVKFSVGLDRIDNTRGYEKNNVLPCCTVCNRTRRDDYSVEETRAMVQLVISMRLKKAEEKNNG